MDTRVVRIIDSVKFMLRVRVRVSWINLYGKIYVVFLLYETTFIVIGVVPLNLYGCM